MKDLVLLYLDSFISYQSSFLKFILFHDRTGKLFGDVSLVEHMD